VSNNSAGHRCTPCLTLITSLTAVNFALACNLHNISSPKEGDDSSITLLRPYPMNAWDLQHRINAFWCTFTMDRSLSCMFGFDVALPDAVELPFLSLSSL
jgi:hypothetical protein